MNIEVFLYEKLSEALPVPVYTEHQENDPESFVIIDKTGSSKMNHLLSSTVVFQSYAKSKHEAAELNEKVKEAVENLICFDEVSDCKLNSDYPFNDLSTKRHRYQAVFDIYHY